MFRLFGVFVVALSLSLSAEAAPSITGQSGTWTNGSAVTLTGSGFSTKSPAAPVAWDTFEDGAVNTTATVGSWGSVNSLSIRSVQNRHSFSSYTSGSIFNGVWPTYSNAYLTGGSNATTWYVQYWLKLGSNFNWSSNIDNSRGNVKFFRMWDTGPDSKNFVAAFHQGDHVCAVVEQCTTAGPTCYMYDYNPTTELDNNQWNLLQFEYRESSAADTADGVWRMWSNGQLIYNYTNLTTKCSGHTSNSRPFIVGLFDSHDSGGTTSDVYLDDAYIDNKWNRVELANSATYGSATIREIQPPTSWSDTSITVTLNIGALTGTAYLFVTDSTGARNATGYAVTLGAASDTTAPTAPSIKMRPA